jgi:hypothetical protein
MDREARLRLVAEALTPGVKWTVRLGAAKLLGISHQALAHEAFVRGDHYAKRAGGDEKTRMNRTPEVPALAKQIDAAAEEYRKTLLFFKQPRELLPMERRMIGAAIQRYGFEPVRMALMGARHEPRGERFDPSDWVSVDRYLSAKNFARFLGLGAKASERARAAATPRAAAEPPHRLEPQPAEPAEPEPPADPDRVRAVIRDAFAGREIGSRICAHEESEQVSTSVTELEGRRFQSERHRCKRCGAQFARTHRIG